MSSVKEKMKIDNEDQNIMYVYASDRYLQMNRLSLRNNRLEFKTSGKSRIVSEESIEYT